MSLPYVVVTVLVTPLTRKKIPEVVVHKSPFAGVLGAVPCGALKDAVAVVQAGVMTFTLAVMAVSEAFSEDTLLTFKSTIWPDVALITVCPLLSIHMPASWY
jgi:hypothetical protein